MNTRSDIKRILNLALLVGMLAAFAVLPVTADAAVISINIESVHSSGGDYNPMYGDNPNSFVTGTDTEWNVLWAGDAGDGFKAGLAWTDVLGTMDGSPTGNDVKFSIGSIDGIGYSAPGKTRVWCKADSIQCQDSGSHQIYRYEFKYHGLIPGESYDLKFNCYGGATRVSIGGVSIRSTDGMLNHNGIIADAEGKITGELYEAFATAGDKLYWMQIEGKFESMGGYPSGGIEVEPANPLTLSWTNMTPNVGSDVYVDVWFGTDPDDPNSFHKIIDANTVPSEGLNLTSVDVDASGNPQDYYWRVDSYLDGADNIRDANMVEGPLYHFIAKGDASPYNVSAGDDWITWAGEPVDLLGSYVDDGESPVTVTWSSSDPNVVFTPSNDGGATSFHIAPQVTVDYAAGPVTLTFTVEDEGNDPVSDTMTIEVYKDVCAAGVAAGLSAIYPGDINADCVTNIDDLLLIAQSWLVDTKLTESVAK